MAAGVPAAHTGGFMTQPFKDAVGICKAIMRNGFDAYVINARLQEKALDHQEMELDICTELSLKDLQKLFPNAEASASEAAFARLKQGEIVFRFYPADIEDGSHPEECVARVTPRLLKKLTDTGELPMHLACPYLPRPEDAYEGFADLETGEIRLLGFPDQSIKQDYLLAVRALRFSANYHLPIEANTWMAILRSAQRVLDYVSMADVMDEWRKVEAENMADFVNLLYESMILHGLIPEIATMARIRQKKNEREEETVFDHTLEVMRHYPQELPYDWYGTMACLFHDVGKLHTAEYFEDRWTFYQHHRVGAKVTRKILSRLGFPPEEVDLICLLVRHHMRFHFMLTDRGIRRFKALDEYPRLIEMVRADIKARGGSYKEFNHNLKMLEERSETPEEMLEPLLNGAVIMQITGLNPGPAVGLIRQNLLKAQIAGDVTCEEEAVAFVKKYYKKEKLG
jgi:poly(A) polymerase